MKIGLDAKRVFSNPTGLGVYGRNLVRGLSKIDSQNQYILYTPRGHNNLLKIDTLGENFDIQKSIGSSGYFWRTFSIVKDIRLANLDIYHGLSSELPYNIKNSNAKSIVDIHDLCYVRYPSDYSVFDRNVFWQKAKSAAQFSDQIIATSEATKRDIIQYFEIDPNKIEVVYQCCDKRFYQTIPSSDLNTLREKYQLPRKYILSVGTIQGRKNQKAILRAMALLPLEEQIPIILVGNGKTYLKELEILGEKLNVDVRVKRKIGNKDLPGIYQMATLFIYPSFVEGFGIPVLEAMASKVPVITSIDTSMAEIVKNKNALIDPNNDQELAAKIQEFLGQPNDEQIEQNFKRSFDFSQEKFAKQILNIYTKLCR